MTGDALSDLTLQHSRDLSALEAERRRQLDRVEGDRQAALHALAAARPALTTFDAACADAATAWLDALQANRAQQQDDLRTALDKERRQVDQAANKRDAAQKAADLVYQQAVKLARTRLTNTLAAVPDAAKAQAEFDARRDD